MTKQEILHFLIFLETLGVADQFMKNHTNTPWMKYYRDESSLIERWIVDCVFVWSLCPEGHGFWEKIAKWWREELDVAALEPEVVS